MDTLRMDSEGEARTPSPLDDKSTPSPTGSSPPVSPELVLRENAEGAFAAHHAAATAAAVGGVARTLRRRKLSSNRRRKFTPTNIVGRLEMDHVTSIDIGGGGGNDRRRESREERPPLPPKTPGLTKTARVNRERKETSPAFKTMATYRKSSSLEPLQPVEIASVDVVIRLRKV